MDDMLNLETDRKGESRGEIDIMVEPGNELNNILFRQVDSLLANRTEVLLNQGNDPETVSEETRFLSTRFKSIIAERNKRADEYESDEVANAIKIVEKRFKVPLYGISCIDSRLMRTIVYGIPLGPGGFTRVEAGDVKDFVQGPGTDLVLMKGSYYENALDEAFSKNDIVAEALDSHVECAARKRDESRRSRVAPSDGGLLADVIRKSRIAKAHLDLVDSGAEPKYEGKRVIPIQTSFDPTTGFMYMGLEKEESLAFALQEAQTKATHEKKSTRHAKAVYTGDVLEKLTDSGKIIHSKSFLDDPSISEAFDRHFIPELDWSRNYVRSMADFWRNIDEMIDEGVLDTISGKVRETFTQAPEDEIEEKALMLLTNVFNAYDLTRVNGGKWPYSEHEENCFVISEGENGPYAENPSFGVHSKARQELASGTITAEEIIRDNRKAGRIRDVTGTYKDHQAYIEAPIPGVLKVIVRENGIDWDSVRNLDWSNLPGNWHEMDSAEFMRALSGMGDISLRAAQALNLLREKMAILYDPKSKTSEPLLGTEIEILPVLVDKDRRIQAIATGFVYEGHERK